MKFGTEIKSSIRQKNTKFSAKIEDGSDSPFTNGNALTELGGTITDFNIRAVLNMNLRKKNKEDNLKTKEDKGTNEGHKNLDSEEINENEVKEAKHKK